MSANQEIKEWMKGDQNYSDGLSLYLKYGRNKRLATLFAKGESTFNRQKLTYELSKLAQVKIVKSRTIKKRIQKKQPKVKRFSEKKHQDINHQALPDELKKLHFELIDASKQARKLHEEQLDLLDKPSDHRRDEEMRQRSDKIVALKTFERKAYRVLDHFQDTGEILDFFQSKSEKQEDVTALTDDEINKLLDNAYANVSRTNKRIKEQRDKLQLESNQDKRSKLKRMLEKSTDTLKKHESSRDKYLNEKNRRKNG